MDRLWMPYSWIGQAIYIYIDAIFLDRPGYIYIDAIFLDRPGYGCHILG